MQKQVHTYQFFRSGPLPGHHAEKHSHMQRIINQVLAIIFLLISTTGLFAQDLGFQWVNGILGGGGGAAAPVYSMSTDASGNIYVTGLFAKTTDFDPGPGVFNLTSVTGSDSFVCKYDREGKLIWARQFSRTDPVDPDGYQCIAYTVAAAPGGSVYVGGEYRGTTDFDPGPGVSYLTGASGNSDGYVTKLDGNGNFVWAQKIGIDLQIQRVWGLTVDPNGDVIVTGEFGGAGQTVSFGSFGLVGIGIVDSFVGKINPSGVFQWVKRIGGAGQDRILSKAVVDNSGSIYIGGRSGGGTTGMASLAVGAFVLKLDTDGNTVWADLSSDATNFTEIDLDAVGNVYAAGTGTVNLIKLNGSGVRQWAKTLGSIGGLDFGADDYLCVAGSYLGTTTMGATTLTSNGGSDIYII